jgi:hypothetical protein
VCVEDVEHECIERSERQYECKEIKKHRFNCTTQYIDEIEVKQLHENTTEIVDTFTCEDITLKVIEIYPKITIIYEYNDRKILEVWI